MPDVLVVFDDEDGARLVRHSDLVLLGVRQLDLVRAECARRPEIHQEARAGLEIDGIDIQVAKRDGDLITVDAVAGRLDLDGVRLSERSPQGAAPQGEEWAGTGRELFAAFRATVGTADMGASVFPSYGAPQQEVPVVQAV